MFNVWQKINNVIIALNQISFFAVKTIELRNMLKFSAFILTNDHNQPAWFPRGADTPTHTHSIQEAGPKQTDTCTNTDRHRFQCRNRQEHWKDPQNGCFHTFDCFYPFCHHQFSIITFIVVTFSFSIQVPNSVQSSPCSWCSEEEHSIIRHRITFDDERDAKISRYGRSMYLCFYFQGSAIFFVRCKYRNRNLVSTVLSGLCY